MRITDVCPLLDDALCIAALYLSVLGLLYRLRRSNQRWRRYAKLLIDENRWRAQRYGLDEGLVDFGRGEVIPVAELMAELMELIREDAQDFDCVAEIEHSTEILRRGTSAHRQLAAYAKAKDAGAEHIEALRAVVDLLIAETVTGV